MANIKVNDIKLAGRELFADAESFISELEDNELQLVGGIQPADCAVVTPGGRILINH